MPATTKSYTDIKFFLKTPETIAAFTSIPFTGSGAEEVYPNEDFDNVREEEEPFVNLPLLESNYGLKLPVVLGSATVTGTTVTHSSSPGMFTNVSVGNYLLYRIEGEGDDAIDGLKVLGYIQTKTSNDVVVLSKTPPSEALSPTVLEVFSWEDDPETLKVLNFNFADNFYMVVKNADYTTSNHDGVLYIDTARTSTNYTNNPQPFAYSASKIIHPGYFSLQRISKTRNPETSEVDVTNIQCSISGVSKWSEKSMFEDLQSTIPQNQIPYWSVYEINPRSDSTSHLDKRTFYRLTISDSLPTSKVVSNYVEPAE